MAGKVRRKVAGLQKREMKIAVNEGRWQMEVITPSVRPNGWVRMQVENAVGLNPNSEQQADQKRGASIKAEGWRHANVHGISTSRAAVLAGAACAIRSASPLHSARREPRCFPRSDPTGLFVSRKPQRGANLLPLRAAGGARCRRRLRSRPWPGDTTETVSAKGRKRGRNRKASSVKTLLATDCGVRPISAMTRVRALCFFSFPADCARSNWAAGRLCPHGAYRLWQQASFEVYGAS